jgi:DNA polymerase-4
MIDLVWPERSDGHPVRSILHVDMDAFFVSAELLRHPELRGQPVVVGGSGERGVVAAANYEARAHGVYSAMPSVRARRLCPHAVFLAGDHGYYGELSSSIMAILRSFTPLVEPLSLDEAFLDVSGVRRTFGDAPTVAAAIRERVDHEQGLPCSVGVATSKFVAKLASQDAKPRASLDGTRAGVGVKVILPGTELDYLRPLPVERLWGVGPATLTRLRRLGVTSVADLADFPLDSLAGSLGSAAGHHLWALAHGIDERPVEPEQRPKSIGHEETFAHDHHERATLEREIVRMADAVGSRLRGAGVAGRTITLKVRFHDFRTITRASTQTTPVDTAPVIARVAKELLGGVDPAPGVRLIGVSVSGLTGGDTRQLSLDDLGAPSWDEATRAVDSIRARFGDDAIGPASLQESDGLRLKRRGDQQWGPDGPDDGPATDP